MRSATITCNVCGGKGEVSSPYTKGKLPQTCGDCRDSIQRRYEAGESQAALARHTGLPVSTVGWLIRKDPRAWLVQRPAGVLTSGEYAQYVGVSGGAVSGWTRHSKIVRQGRWVLVADSDNKLKAAGLWPDDWRAVRPCSRCGLDFAPTQPTALYCSIQCQQRALRSVRRGRERTGITLAVDLGYLFKRDGGRCGICRRPVAMRRQFPDPMSPSPDHIIPLSKGGEHSYRNLQLTHWYCNDRKNNRSAGSQLLLVG